MMSELKNIWFQSVVLRYQYLGTSAPECWRLESFIALNLAWLESWGITSYDEILNLFHSYGVAKIGGPK